MNIFSRILVLIKVIIIHSVFDRVYMLDRPSKNWMHKLRYKVATFVANGELKHIEKEDYKMKPVFM